jgi:hypothetical protein
MGRKIKAWVWAAAVLAILLAVVSGVVQAWAHPGGLLGRDGFWLVQLGGLIVIVAVGRFVRQLVRQDRQRLEDGEQR